MRRVHACSHEKYHVLMPGLSIVHHLLFKELEMILIVPIYLQQPDGHFPVPFSLVNLPPSSLANRIPQFNLFKGNVPFLQVDAGLARFAINHPLQVWPSVWQIFHLILIIFRFWFISLRFFHLFTKRRETYAESPIWGAEAAYKPAVKASFRELQGAGCTHLTIALEIHLTGQSNLRRLQKGIHLL